jgi:hypothetical protein
MYEKIIYSLRIPCLIITDIDIKREEFEKFEKDSLNPRRRRIFLQMTNSKLGDRITTNNTLSYFYNTKLVRDIIQNDYKVKANLMITCQRQKIGKYYPTSFEEAFILTNENVDIVKNVIQRLKPKIYQDVISSGGIYKNSYKLQRKLSDSDSKTDFANALLYEILVCEDPDKQVKLPKYILDGLNFLNEKLGGETNGL